MLDLKQFVGNKYKVTMEESYRNGGDRPNTHYMIVRGSRGDIMAWDDSFLEVTVYGKPLKNPHPDASHNLSLPMKCERLGWKAKNHYDDSTCFLLEKDRIYEAIKVIKARKRRHLSPEQREDATERLRQMRSSKDYPRPGSTLEPENSKAGQVHAEAKHTPKTKEGTHDNG